MSTVYDERLRRTTLVVPCRGCGAEIYWSLSERSRKRTPYCLDADGQPTRDLHWAVCPNPHARTTAAMRKALA